MRISRIVWLEQFKEKCEVKHGVTTDEVADLFVAAPQINFVERGVRVGEDQYAASGQTQAGRTSWYSLSTNQMNRR